MYAKIEYRKVTKAHVKVRGPQIKLLAEEFGIAETTARKYLTDVFNDSITAQKRNEVVTAAINRYQGKLHKETTYKDVLVIDMNDEPENHL